MRAAKALLVLLATILAGCSGSSDPVDDDGDGLLDADELNGWFITIDLVGMRVQRHVTSDPTLPDTDGDGVLDTFEFGLGLDPRSRDTDEDGLSDCEETFHSVLAECEDPDWEGQTDGGLGTIGNNADSDPGFGRYINNVLGYDDQTGTLNAGSVGWGDGIPDGSEIHGYTVVLANNVTVNVRSDPLRKDTDGDFLEDGEEALIYGSHPQIPDTDKDGCVDGLDLFPSFEERFDFGLQSLQLTRSANVWLHMRVVDSLQDSPGGEAGLSVPANQVVDLQGVAGEAVRPAQCSFVPYDPWVRMELIAYAVHADRLERLDIGSQTNPENTFKLWWNVRSSEFAWDPEIERFNGPLTWAGTEGKLTFQPRVLTPGGQAS